MLPRYAEAATVYVSQAGGSVSCGTSGTQTTTAIASVVWTAGNTYELCGSITSQVAPSASGTSGSPITILFASNGILNPTVCPSTGCINIANLSWIVINGGAVCGYVNRVNVSCSGSIYPTASGSAYGNGATSMKGIQADSCANCEIENMDVYLYAHTSSTDAPTGLIECVSIRSGEAAGNFIKVHNNVIHDCGSAIVYVPSGTNDTGPQSYNNYEYNNNSHMDISNNNNGTLTQALVHDNHFGATANWDTTSPLCSGHHNSLHAFAYTTTNSGIQYYNNYIDGNWGNCPTSELFFEGNGSVNNNCVIFNNVFNATYQQMNNGVVYATCGGASYFLNNTILGDVQPGDNGLALTPNSGATWVVENNLIGKISGTDYLTNAALATLTGGVTTWDYNLYSGNGSLSNVWAVNCGSGCTYYSTLAAWTTATTFDSHGQAGASSTFLATNSDGTLQSTSPAIGGGQNLTSLGFSALDSDIAGNPRPATGAWDAGAYNSVTAVGSKPAAPTNLLDAVN